MRKSRVSATGLPGYGRAARFRATAVCFIVTPGNRPSVLLASASYGGTIASVRYLGGEGFNVGVLKSSVAGYSAAAWSRYSARTFKSPRESDNSRFLETLCAIGLECPGQVLLPTSDETAWLYAERAAELERFFCLYQPPLSTIRRILDKKLFEEAAITAGIAVLPSWEPKSVTDVAALAPGLPYPVLIKRRSHVRRVTNHKGIVVRSEDDLVREYEKFVFLEKSRVSGKTEFAESDLPFLQQLVRVADEGVCSVTGFIDRTGELFVTRRSTKVYQRSQPVGVGVCFESLPSDPELDGAVGRLCRELGYFGIFEVEFLRFNDAWAVIDFNPRLFNQIGMDIRRGMPLPLLACLDAAGDIDALRAAVAKAKSVNVEDSELVFCDGFTLRAILAARRLTGRISRAELAYWRSWQKQHAAHTVDVARDRDDPLPAFVHALSEIYLGIQALPKFLRLTPRVSSEMPRSPIEARS